MVSHDRDFLDGLVDKLYEFRDGHVKEHLGSVQEFLEKRKMESLAELERKAAPETTAKPSSAPQPVSKAESIRQFQLQKERSKEERRIRSRIAFLEKEIGAHEAGMAELEIILANPGKSDDILELTRSYLEHKRALDADTEEWTQLMEKLEE